MGDEGRGHAVGLVLPELKGKLDGSSVRVPTPNVSMVDLVFVPSSRIGNAIQRVDMYVTQLLLFRGVGLGVNYQINEPGAPPSGKSYVHKRA